MTEPAKESKTESTPRGPKPEVLKIDGDWQDAVRTSLSKKKPAEGWPKEKPTAHQPLPYNDQEAHH
jgi:hypothetical protein